MQTRMEEILAKDSDAFFKGRKKEFAYRPLLSTRYECPENIFVLCKLDSSRFLSKNREGGRESLNQNKLRKVEEGGETRVENATVDVFRFTHRINFFSLSRSISRIATDRLDNRISVRKTSSQLSLPPDLEKPESCPSF